MGCEDFACDAKDEISTLFILIRLAFEHLATTWDLAGWKIVDLLKEHGEKLVALTSLVFGVWRWWLYREKVLYKRLEEFVRESDRRLAPASNEVVKAILRPSDPIPLTQPAYAIELRRVLDAHGWRSWFWFGGLEAQAERQISKLMSGIRKRERILERAQVSLEEQKTQAHLLAGAIYSARARRTTGESKSAAREDHHALREFQEVLQSPRHDRNLVAKEWEAFQFMRLGKFDLASAAYEELEEIAKKQEPNKRLQDLLVARAWRYRAQLLQILCSPNASQGAWNLIAKATPPTSLSLRQPHGPYLRWEAIEQGETHFVSAFIASKFVRWNNEETKHLGAAEQSYRDVLDKLPSINLFMSKADRQLRDEAEAGLLRIEKARQGIYDLYWLSFGHMR